MSIRCESLERTGARSGIPRKFGGLIRHTLGLRGTCCNKPLDVASTPDGFVHGVPESVAATALTSSHRIGFESPGLLRNRGTHTAKGSYLRTVNRLV